MGEAQHQTVTTIIMEQPHLMARKGKENLTDLQMPEQTKTAPVTRPAMKIPKTHLVEIGRNPQPREEDIILRKIICLKALTYNLVVMTQNLRIPCQILQMSHPRPYLLSHLQVQV